MFHDFDALVRRLERAQALQNQRFTLAAGGEGHPLGGGFVHVRGEGHPLNQALGLLDPVSPAELEAAEARLGWPRHPAVLELSPGAPEGLWTLLAARGYRLGTFQQLWAREVAPEAPAGAEVRLVGPGEGDRFARLVGACFAARDDWETYEPPFRMGQGVEGAWAFLAFADGMPAGGAMLGVVDGVALLSGDGVLPRFRGRGLQKALIRARLRMAAELGCEVACAGTLPGTASQRSYEACGFRAAYPKVEMVRDPT